MLTRNEMTKLEKIDYIITKTVETHASSKKEDILEAIIFFNNFENYITSRDNAREISKTITNEDAIKEVAKFALKVAKADSNCGTLPGKRECINFLNCLKACRVEGKDIVKFLTTHPKQLEILCKVFANIRYGNDNTIDLERINNTSAFDIKSYLYYLQDNSEILQKMKISRLKIFDRSINKCREDIIKGIQLQKGNVEYSLGNSMFAKSMIGNKKENQEDSVLLLEHPDNKNFKMLLVADGIGGNYNGDEASSYTAQKMLAWFERLNPKYCSDLDKLSVELERELKHINSALNNKNDDRGTTFLCGIVGKDETLITSIGDSRAYITKNNNLYQISRDDSIVQDYYELGIIREKDDMRFHKKANCITRCLGMDEKALQINNRIIENSSYDTLILVSDGVSDCLSDSQIMAITTKTPREKIAKALVEAANKSISTRRNTYDFANYHDIIYGGKDNETAAVYLKK